MPESLLSPVDVDIVLQWAEMQKILDDLSETEDDSSIISADSYENSPSASDVVSVASDLDLRTVGRGNSFADESLLASPLAASLAASLAGADSLLSDGINGVVLDSRHLLNAARADAKMSGHIASLLQARAKGGSLDDSLSSHEELQSFLPPLLFGSRSFPRSSMGSLYGQGVIKSTESLFMTPCYGHSSSSSSRDGEDEDDDAWVTSPGKPWPGGADAKAGKTRFAWSAELHARFEEAVAKLGVDRAKPQAISQLMGVEGDNAPTRQNIKSHLQKYRLLLKKRAAQAANDLSSGSGAGSPTMKMRSATKCAPA
jgi:SHAQKYF class myb-like DNA-binding protein